MLCGELFPTEIRATSNGIVMATSYVVLMGNYKLYPMAVETFGFHYVVYFYAGITATATLWGLLTIKNTDRLSLTEIQDMHKETEVPEQRTKEGGEKEEEERGEGNFNAIRVEIVDMNHNERDDGKGVHKRSVLNHAHPLEVTSKNKTEDKKEGLYSPTVCEAINVG